MMFMGLGTVVLFGVLASHVAAQTKCPAELKAECRNPDIPSVCRTAKCPKTVVGTEKFKKAILKIHNEKRKLPFTNGSFGGDMMKLEWDDQLATAAQKWAHELCIQDDNDYDKKECRKTLRYDSVGQNIFSDLDPKYGDEVLSAEEAVNNWYSEIEFAKPGNMFPYISEPLADHYTQLVWSRSYRVGCAYLRQDNDDFKYQVFIICNYAPAGNVEGENVFDPSNQLASSCRAGSTKGSSGLCEVTDEKTYRKSVGLKNMKQKRR